MTHTIRLRGFWESAADGPLTTHTRRFGRPRTLAPGERVWLVCASAPGPVEVSVNGRVVAAAGEGPMAVDVTDHLLPRNTVQLAAESAASVGEVWLEIRPPPA
jgi:hypothetical protein